MNYYVSNAGDDSRDGLSEANAWRTMAKVLRLGSSAGR